MATGRLGEARGWGTASGQRLGGTDGGRAGGAPRGWLGGALERGRVGGAPRGWLCVAVSGRRRAAEPSAGVAGAFARKGGQRPERLAEYNDRSSSHEQQKHMG